MRLFRTFLVTAILALFAVGAFGQTVILTWTASPTTGIANYNVYRAVCTGTITSNVCSAAGSYAKVGSVAVPTLTYTDTTVLAGAAYDFYVTSQCPTAGCSTTPPVITGESGPSPHFAISIPAHAPLPPGSLTITQTARYLTPGGQTVFTAQWETAPNTITMYTLKQKNKLLTADIVANKLGVYTLVWTGTATTDPITFQVCLSRQGCQSKTL